MGSTLNSIRLLIVFDGPGTMLNTAAQKLKKKPVEELTIKRRGERGCTFPTNFNLITNFFFFCFNGQSSQMRL